MRQGKEIKTKKTRNREVTFSLFTDDMIVLPKFKELPKILAIINEFSKVSVYNVNMYN